jgi:transposase-like protein
MTVMESGSEILKVDEVGRVRTPPEKRERLLAEFDRSGMTGAQFARFAGVRYPTLMNWLQKRRKEAGQSEQMAGRGQDHPRWLEARVEGEVPKTENIEVEVGCGVRILVGNGAQAALAGELLRAMGLGRGC